MTFKQFIENINDVQAAIQSLLLKVQKLPDTDNDKDLFGEKNYKRIMLHFYQDLLNNMDDELAKRLSLVSLDGDPYKIFRTINSGGHPVRDYLINK